MEISAPQQSDEQISDELYELFDPDGLAFWNFLKQNRTEIVAMVENYHAETLLGQHEARVETTQVDALTNQHYTTAEKKELHRLRLFVKDYFAELFLASMSLIGMLLAVLYMLARTWR